MKDDQIEKDFEKYFATARGEDNIMPNVVGMPVMDAISLLENLGLQVVIEGDGEVKNQSVAPGEKIKIKQKVALKLS